jgi:hypothetical protein
LRTLVCSDSRKCFEAWGSAAMIPWMQVNLILCWTKWSQHRLN